MGRDPCSRACLANFTGLVRNQTKNPRLPSQRICGIQRTESSSAPVQWLAPHTQVLHRQIQTLPGIGVGDGVAETRVAQQLRGGGCRREHPEAPQLLHGLWQIGARQPPPVVLHQYGVLRKKPAILPAH